MSPRPMRSRRTGMIAVVGDGWAFPVGHFPPVAWGRVLVELRRKGMTPHGRPLQTAFEVKDMSEWARIDWTKPVAWVLDLGDGWAIEGRCEVCGERPCGPCSVRIFNEMLGAPKAKLRMKREK